jgi:uncharacterized protein (TIGR02118 family)
MVKVTILYRKSPTSFFDFDYYLNVHMPLSIERLGASMDRIEVERVLDPGPPWEKPAFAAICSFVCSSRDAFERAFFRHMSELQADVVNYTDSEQTILISDIEIDHQAAESARHSGT